MTQPVQPTIDYARPGGRATSPLLVLLAWLVVGLPAGWGVTQTVIKSLALFRNAPAAPVAPATAPSSQSPPATAAG